MKLTTKNIIKAAAAVLKNQTNVCRIGVNGGDIVLARHKLRAAQRAYDRLVAPLNDNPSECRTATIVLFA